MLFISVEKQKINTYLSFFCIFEIPYPNLFQNLSKQHAQLDYQMLK